MAGGDTIIFKKDVKNDESGIDFEKSKNFNLIPTLTVEKSQ